MNKNKLASKFSIRNFCMKFQAALILECIAILLRATRRPVKANSDDFFVAFVISSRLRSCQDRASACVIRLSISIMIEKVAQDLG